MTNNEKTKATVKCLAIDQYVTSNIVEPTELFIKDKSFVAWGEFNNYPDYIEDLYQNVSLLHSIVDGTTDYVIGEDVKFDTLNQLSNFNKVNSRGHSIKDIVDFIAKDLVKYNGFALNIIKSKTGEILEIHYLDFKKIRSNKEGSKLYYSTEWNKSFGRTKYIEYNSTFSREGRNEPSTIFYYKNDINRIYPTPMYAAAVVSCEIERQMNDYHLNNIMNGFSSNYIINMNNGKPSDEIQEEIEEQINDKFCGAQNAGRIMLSFNNGKDNETTVVKVETDNYAEKYKTLAERTQKEIFTSFRATPNLFGIPTETTGFSQQEYAEAYKLFNKTVVEPLQNKIKNAFEKIFNIEDILEITPFSLDALEDDNKNTIE